MAGDTNVRDDRKTINGDDIFVHDRVTATTKLVSVSSSGIQANDDSYDPTISGDGRYVLFGSWASNLVGGDVNGRRDVFVHDRKTGTTKVVSVGSSGQPSFNTWGDPEDISSDGRYVVFNTDASGIVPTGPPQVVRRDLTTGTNTLISRGNGGAHLASITDDGRFVAFESRSDNIVPNDTNDASGGRLLSGRDIFVHDTVTGATTRVSVSSQGAQTTTGTNSDDPTISNQGRYVVFESGASNLVAGDTCCSDVFMHDRTTGTTTRVSTGPGGTQSDGTSDNASLSGDGRFPAFVSTATNLVANDTNAAWDVFAHDYGPTKDGLVPIPAVPETQTFGSGPGIHGINPTGLLGDPVNTATGSFVFSVTDAFLPGIGVPFSFTRSYTSADTTQGSLGKGWTHSYAASLSIQGNGDVVLRGENGQQLYFTKQADGTFKSAPGGRSRLGAVAGGYELVRSDQTKYGFDAQGRLTSMKDRNGQGLTFTYGANGLLETANTAGRVISFSYDPAGLLSGISLPDGRSVAYAYTAGLLTSVTDVRGNTTTYSYDAAGRLTKVLDQNNHTVVENVYGADGRVMEQFDARGNRSTFAWDPATQTATMTDARGNAWKDVYSDNVLMKRIDPLGNETSFAYDTDLNVVRTKDPRGFVTNFSYDGRGNLTKKVAPPGLWYEDIYTYNSRNDVTSHTDDLGNTTTFDYDATGNLIRTTEPGGIVTEYGRASATGLVTSVTDPRGKVTRYDYDAAGNLTKLTSPLGNVTTMGYDAAGRMTSRVEPRGNITGANPADHKTTYAYNAANQLTSQADPLGNATTFGYDPAGNLTSRTDAKNRLTSYAYNPANHLTSVTAPDNTVTSYAYDAVGNLTSRTDANNHMTTYTHDAANRLASVTSPTGQRWTYAHDPSGNLTNIVDAIGNSTPDPSDGTTTYEYDELNRQTKIDHSDSTPDVTFTYDADDNRTSMSDGSGTETYAYDALERLTKVTRGQDVFSYAHDPAGNVIKRTYPDGTVIDNAYDGDGRLASVTSAGGTTSYQYDAAAHLTKTTLPAANGYAETRAYDRASRLTDVVNAKDASILSKATYTLDEVGNPTSVATTTGTTTYAYDNRDRLTEACFAAGCPGANDPFIRYAYDAVGNRTTETRPSGVTTYTYNASDQLVSTNGPGGTTSYGYDVNGNQTAAGSRAFAYDRDNRLVSTTQGTTTTTYAYDGLGKRLQASTGSQAAKKTNYVWDPSFPVPELALERDGNNASLRGYVHGQDLISMNAARADYYFHHDGLGSVVNLTNSSGATQWTYNYEPFGSIRTEVKNTTKAPGNLMRFTGELLDTDTGLYHLRARQYDPGLGRFTATDPVSPSIIDPYLSAYAYVNDRPTVFTDPSGMVPLNYESESVYVPVGPALQLLGVEGKIYIGPPLTPTDDDGFQAGLNAYQSCFRTATNAPLVFSGGGAAVGTVAAPGAGTAAGSAAGFSAGVSVAVTSPVWCLFPAAIAAGR